VSHVLLVADAANIDMCLTNFLGARPTQRERPRFDVLARWLVDRAGDAAQAEAGVFLTVAPHNAGPVRGWVQWLLEQGYRVFAKPRVAGNDVDDDMLAHIHARLERGGVDEVVVVSNDARAFLEPLERAAADGVRATVLGFSEYAAGLADSDAIGFIDLEDIPGLFDTGLPGRVRLDALPPGGRWFEPTGPLGGAPGRPVPRADEVRSAPGASA
jgi:putative heme uptake system protein